MGTHIGSGVSNGMGVAKAVLINSLAAAICYYLLHALFSGVSEGLSRFLSFTVWGLAAASLYTSMLKNTANVRPGYEGVHTVFGGITGLLYGIGEHPLLPGLEDVIEVDVRDKLADPEPFTDLARDNVPVFVDGYAVVRIEDSIKYLTSIGEANAIDALTKLLDAEIRLFIAQWERAEDLVEERELLARFLSLPDKKCNEYKLLRRDLTHLTKGRRPPLKPGSVKNILANTGKFYEAADRWGFRVVSIHMEHVDLPEAIKNAAAKAAAARDEMKVHEVRQERRLLMIKKLKKALPGLSERDAIIAIDQLLDLAVKRSIVEVDIRDLNEISKNLGSEVAKAAASIFNTFNKKGS